MTIAWDGYQALLAVDCAAADTSLTVFDATDAPSAPFDIIMGLERMTVTAKADSSFGTNTLWSVTRGVNSTPVVPEGYFAGATLTEVRHEFIVYVPGSTTSIFCDLTPVMESCECTYGIPGGLQTATISFHTYTPTRYFPDEDALLVIRSNESGSMVPVTRAFFGIPNEVRLDDGGYEYQLTFFGVADTIGDDGDMYDNTIEPVAGYFDSGVGWWTAFTSIGQVAKDVIRDLCWYTVGLNYTHVVDGGQQIGKEFNGLGKNAAEIINELASTGDTGDALDWAIFTEANGDSLLWLYRRSRWLGVTIPWSLVSPPVLPESVPISWNSRERKNKIIVKYNGGYAVAQGSTGGAGHRPKASRRDTTNTIQDYASAYSMATTLLNAANTLQSISENAITLQYKADAPGMQYLVDQFGTELPLWRGEQIVGRQATIAGVTATNANWPITPMQIRSYQVSYTGKSATVQLGKYVDWMVAAAQGAMLDAQRPDSTLHTPGSSSAFAAPQSALPIQGGTSANVPVASIPNSAPGATKAPGTIGTHQVQDDLDLAPPQWIYDSLDAPLPVGFYGDITLHLNGHILGFNFRGRDVDGNATSGVFKIYKGRGSGTPTLVSTLTISGSQTGEEVFAPNAALDVVAGDFLRLEINANDASTGFAHITVDATFRRTGGSDRPVSTASAGAPSVSHTQDPVTGVITFHITTDRPAHAWVAYDVVSGGPYRNVTGVTPDLSKTPEPATFAIPSGVTMYGVVHLLTADNVETVGPEFSF